MDILEARVGFHLAALCSAAPDKRQAIAWPGTLVQSFPGARLCKKLLIECHHLSARSPASADDK